MNEYVAQKKNKKEYHRGYSSNFHFFEIFFDRGRILHNSLISTYLSSREYWFIITWTNTTAKKRNKNGNNRVFTSYFYFFEIFFDALKFRRNYMFSFEAIPSKFWRKLFSYTLLLTRISIYYGILTKTNPHYIYCQNNQSYVKFKYVQRNGKVKFVTDEDIEVATLFI